MGGPADGGCPRCASAAAYGEGYDTCLCVHAEENAVLLAARHGTATEGCVVYTTLRPCFLCLRHLIQAGIQTIVYDEDLPYVPEIEERYQQLVQQAATTLRRYAPGTTPP